MPGGMAQHRGSTDVCTCGRPPVRSVTACGCVQAVQLSAPCTPLQTATPESGVWRVCTS